MTNGQGKIGARGAKIRGSGSYTGTQLSSRSLEPFTHFNKKNKIIPSTAHLIILISRFWHDIVTLMDVSKRRHTVGDAHALNRRYFLRWYETPQSAVINSIALIVTLLFCRPNLCCHKSGGPFIKVPRHIVTEGSWQVWKSITDGELRQTWRTTWVLFFFLPFLSVYSTRAFKAKVLWRMSNLSSVSTGCLRSCYYATVLHVLNVWAQIPGQQQALEEINAHSTDSIIWRWVTRKADGPFGMRTVESIQHARRSILPCGHTWPCTDDPFSPWTV